jgi:hypothetical protein
MCSEEPHQKSSEGSVVQSDWLPKYHMEMGNESSAAKDFSGQKKVITTNESAPHDTRLESSHLAPFRKSRKANVLLRRQRI